MSKSSTLRVGQHQPLLHDFVGAALSPDFVAAIAVQDEWRALARFFLIADLDAHATIFPVEVRLGAKTRKAREPMASNTRIKGEKLSQPARARNICMRTPSGLKVTAA